MALRAVIVLLMLSPCFGCATVKPWDRGMLAKPKMAVGSDPLASQLEQHVYQYREGAVGGYGSVGGGCGCN